MSKPKKKWSRKKAKAPRLRRGAKVGLQYIVKQVVRYEVVRFVTSLVHDWLA